LVGVHPPHILLPRKVLTVQAVAPLQESEFKIRGSQKGMLGDKVFY
jgi:hypothetical protein